VLNSVLMMMMMMVVVVVMSGGVPVLQHPVSNLCRCSTAGY